MYFVLPWTKNFSEKGMSDVTSYTDWVYIEWLVNSKIKNA